MVMVELTGKGINVAQMKSNKDMFFGIVSAGVKGIIEEINGEDRMTGELFTVEEIIKELEKLSDNTVIKVEYDGGLHNHPFRKIQLTLHIEEANKMSGLLK